ncbi:hypothetical protein LJR084_007285 [Variovorax sp. LjRoot84]
MPDEDARRTHRELARLTTERTAHMNRIGSLLVLHNLRPNVVIGGRDWAKWLEHHRERSSHPNLGPWCISRAKPRPQTQCSAEAIMHPSIH